MLLNGANEIYHVIPPCLLSAKSGQLHYSYSVRLQLKWMRNTQMIYCPTLRQCLPSGKSLILGDYTILKHNFILRMIIINSHKYLNANSTVSLILRRFNVFIPQCCCIAVLQGLDAIPVLQIKKTRCRKTGCLIEIIQEACCKAQN